MSPLSGTNPSIFRATTFNKMQRIRPSVWWLFHVIGRFVLRSDTLVFIKGHFYVLHQIGFSDWWQEFLSYIWMILWFGSWYYWVFIITLFCMVFLVPLNTLKPRQNGHHVDNDISNAFCWIKIFIFWFKLLWSLFPLVQLTINQPFKQWLGPEQTTSHYLNQRCPSLLTHICVTQPQCVKKPWRGLLNPLHDKFFRGNINIYLHFVSFLYIDRTQVVEILPQIRQEPTYST